MTWLFSLLLGYLGVDRFYLGKVGTGILKLVTCGGAGIWYLVDLVIVLTGNQTDKAGQKLEGYEQHKKLAWIVSAAAVLLSAVIGAVNAASGTDDPDALPPAATASAPGQPEDPTTAPPASEEPGEATTPPSEPAEPDPMDGTRAWADETFGTFEAESHKGDSDDVVALPSGATGGIVKAAHKGSGNFAINVLDDQNESTGELLVNTIGRYSGSTVFGDGFSEGVKLEVTADGPWTIRLSPMSSAPALKDSGEGDSVFLYSGDAASVTFDHRGDGNVTLHEDTADDFEMGLLVNEIGPYKGTVAIGAGPSVISVGGDGKWTLDLT